MQCASQMGRRVGYALPRSYSEAAEWGRGQMRGVECPPPCLPANPRMPPMPPHFASSLTLAVVDGARGTGAYLSKAGGSIEGGWHLCYRLHGIGVIDCVAWALLIALRWHYQLGGIGIIGSPGFG